MYFWLQKYNISSVSSVLHHWGLRVHLGWTDSNKLLHLLFEPSYRGGQAFQTYTKNVQVSQGIQKEKLLFFSSCSVTQVIDI